jgi:hypothetical protein
MLELETASLLEFCFNRGLFSFVIFLGGFFIALKRRRH